MIGYGDTAEQLKAAANGFTDSGQEKVRLQSSDCNQRSFVDGTMDFPEDEAGVETTEMVAGVRGTGTAQQDKRYRVGG